MKIKQRFFFALIGYPLMFFLFFGANQAGELMKVDAVRYAVATDLHNLGIGPKAQELQFAWIPFIMLVISGFAGLFILLITTLGIFCPTDTINLLKEWLYTLKTNKYENI